MLRHTLTPFKAAQELGEPATPMEYDNEKGLYRHIADASKQGEQPGSRAVAVARRAEVPGTDCDAIECRALCFSSPLLCCMATCCCIIIAEAWRRLSLDAMQDARLARSTFDAVDRRRPAMCRGAWIEHSAGYRCRWAVSNRRSLRYNVTPSATHVPRPPHAKAKANAEAEHSAGRSVPAPLATAPSTRVEVLVSY